MTTASSKSPSVPFSGLISLGMPPTLEAIHSSAWYSGPIYRCHDRAPSIYRPTSATLSVDLPSFSVNSLPVSRLTCCHLSANLRKTLGNRRANLRPDFRESRCRMPRISWPRRLNLSPDIRQPLADSAPILCRKIANLIAEEL
jgi:hypothetical protein